MKSQSKSIILFFAIIGCIHISYAQKVKPLNLPTYDYERLHFGFSLGINKADFALYRANNTITPDSVLNVDCKPDWGFNLGIISDLRLHDYVTLRILPALSFQVRKLMYDIDSASNSGPRKFYTAEKSAESTLLDFPINFKIRSQRLNNMSAYLLVGGKYSIDLASQAKTKDPDILKLNKNDLCVEAGVGFDFYLEFFKLSTELKFSAGLRDRLYHESTTWSMPIDKLNSKVWLFSINFEG